MERLPMQYTVYLQLEYGRVQGKVDIFFKLFLFHKNNL